MKFNKLLIISMLVMMICCVSAVSATDINGTDDITVDEVSEVVEEVEIDDVREDVVEQDDAPGIITINNGNYDQYFDEYGCLNVESAQTLIFEGNFNEVNSTFGNFKITHSVGLQFNNATFHNIGLDLVANNLIVDGARFTGDENATNGATLNVVGNDIAVSNVNINVAAPQNDNFYAIDVDLSNNVRLLNNVITYTCGYNNTANYNYVIKAKNSPGLLIKNNTITAYLPLKQVNWNLTGSIDADYVAGVAIENTKVNLTGNDITVIGNKRAGDFPTLDAVIIAQSTDANIESNVIHENDIVTPENGYSYIYGIDVYSCQNIKIRNNTVVMNGNVSGGQIGGNGTGAAYCIQLSGNHSGVEIYDNKLSTQNKGPNLGIYSQNYHAASHLKIYNNRINVTGKAGSDPWSLVSGIEVQDTSAEIYGNNITVNNTAGYVNGSYAFGISYAQYIMGEHYYEIYLNNITVINGDYAIYLLNDTSVTGSVEDCILRAITNTTTNCGDNAILVGDSVSKSGNS